MAMIETLLHNKVPNYAKSVFHNNSELQFNFILSHFEVPLFPRTISTKATRNRQILIHSREEALTWFKAAYYKDCKINAFPAYTGMKDLNRQEPNFIFIDLDYGAFKTREELDRILTKTLKNINDRLNMAIPTVLWSGNGYHIYLPVKAFLLESESVFMEISKEPSRKFIQFAEQFLSDNKSDPEHWKHVSFKNCMIRIPGSINSKNNEQQVKVIQQWDGRRVEINYLLRNFRRYLIQEKFKPKPAVKKQFIVYSTKWRTKK
jgi:hypothetical protein